MKCPQCQFENPDGIKYCGDCGTRIENSCPKCNYINPPQFKFCGSCGHKLEKPSPQEKPIPPSERERKLITVLFSDMSGYKISKRLSEPNSPYRELNGISAAEYLNKAKSMFEKMELPWDLEQLEHVMEQVA